MRSDEEDMPDKKIIEKFLHTVIEKFTYVVVSIEESKDTNNMSIDELQSSLMVHEQKKILRVLSNNTLGNYISFLYETLFKYNISFVNKL